MTIQDNQAGGVKMEALLNAVAHAIEAAYLRGFEWRQENPATVAEYRFKAARDYTDKAFHDPDNELCKAIAALPAAGATPTDPFDEEVVTLAWELLQTVHQPPQKAGTDYWHVTNGKHHEFGRIMSRLLALMTGASPPSPSGGEPEPTDDDLEPISPGLQAAIDGTNARIREAFASPSKPSEAMVATHRHVKRGSEYVLIGYGKMQAEDWYQSGEVAKAIIDGAPMKSVDMREVAIYRSIDDGSLWVRPREEFEDGRFIALTAALSGGGL